MRKLMQHIGVLIMLGVFSFYITPRDFLHHFSGHADTHHESAASPVKGQSVAEQHRHCEWLQWEVDTYLPAHAVFLECIAVQFGVITPALPLFTATSTPYFFALRGPPAGTVVV